MNRDIGKTPWQLGITEKTITPPDAGWLEDTYYIVDIAYAPANPIHRAILYVGYVDKGAPGGYSGIFYTGTHYTLARAYYLRVVQQLDLCEDQIVVDEETTG